LEFSAVNDVVDDVFLREPKFARMYPVDVQPDGRIVHVLRDIDLADPGERANPPRQILRGRCR